MIGLVKEYILPRSVVFTDDFTVLRRLRSRAATSTAESITARRSMLWATFIRNTIDGFWMLVKTGIRGVYHSVGRHYLQTYLDEYSFRYNHRFDTQPMFKTFMQQIEKRDAVIRQTPIEVEPF